MAALAEIEKAARELVARYGDEAVGFARAWAESLAREGMVREEAVALRVMTAAERLLLAEGKALSGMATLPPHVIASGFGPGRARQGG